MNVEQARFYMIEQQIRPWDVHDEQVRNLLARVHREDFVPPQHRQLAFVDMELPLSDNVHAVALGQVMLPPRVEARMLQDLQLAPDAKVLEIGCGSGYMAALLAHKAQSVLSLEIDEALADMARANLQRAGITNVQVRTTDGASADLSGDGPFDAILLSGSVAQLPEHLLPLLAPGGRLMAVVGQDPVMRTTIVQRQPQGFVSTDPWDVVIPPLRHFPTPSAFRF